MDDDPLPSQPQQGCPPHTLIVEIHDTDQHLGADLSHWLKEAANTVCAQLKVPGEIRVLIADDQAMTQAHTQYCGLDSTTDVLTFDLAHESDIANKVLDTDLIVCIDEAKRQAFQRTHDFQHELLLYIIHGTLHCLGYDDHEDESFARMHAREDELLESTGYGRVFSRETSKDES